MYRVKNKNNTIGWSCKYTYRAQKTTFKISWDTWQTSLQQKTFVKTPNPTFWASRNATPPGIVFGLEWQDKYGIAWSHQQPHGIGEMLVQKKDETVVLLLLFLKRPDSKSFFAIFPKRQRPFPFIKDLVVGF